VCVYDIIMMTTMMAPVRPFLQFVYIICFSTPLFVHSLLRVTSWTYSAPLHEDAAASPSLLVPTTRAYLLWTYIYIIAVPMCIQHARFAYNANGTRCSVGILHKIRCTEIHVGICRAMYIQSVYFIISNVSGHRSREVGIKYLR